MFRDETHTVTRNISDLVGLKNAPVLRTENFFNNRVLPLPANCFVVHGVSTRKLGPSSGISGMKKARISGSKRRVQWNDLLEEDALAC